MFSLKILPFHIIFNRNHVIQEEPGVEGAMEVTGQVPESSTADGGYQSAGTQEYAEGKGIEPVFPDFQGRRGAYELEISKDGTSMEATNRTTERKMKAVRTKGGSWRVDDEVDGKKHRCYFTDENVASSMRREGLRGHPQGQEVAEEQRRGHHIPAYIPHTQQQDALQGADEAEYFRDFTLPMGELCPLVTV